MDYMLLFLVLFLGSPFEFYWPLACVDGQRSLRHGRDLLLIANDGL